MNLADLAFVTDSDYIVVVNGRNEYLFVSKPVLADKKGKYPVELFGEPDFWDDNPEIGSLEVTKVKVEIVRNPFFMVVLFITVD